MHYLVRILTTGETRETAHEKALAYADELVEGGQFDYYLEQGRWAESGKTYRVASRLGQLAVERALQSNREEFEYAIHAARMMLAEFTDDQIYEEQFGTAEEARQRDYFPSRWQFSRVHPDRSYLYGDRDLWGEQIRNTTDYQQATQDRDDLWVTALDFHG